MGVNHGGHLGEPRGTAWHLMEGCCAVWSRVAPYGAERCLRLRKSSDVNSQAARVLRRDCRGRVGRRRMARRKIAGDEQMIENTRYGAKARFVWLSALGV